MPASGRNTVMMPLRPPGPATGTDHELPISAWPVRPRNRDQAALEWTSASMTGRWLAAARPTGPPAGAQGSWAHGLSSPGANPSVAAQTSDGSGLGPAPGSETRWMQSRSAFSAAPSADMMSDRLDEASADTRRAAQPGSRGSG